MFKNITMHIEIPKGPLKQVDFGYIDTKYGQMVMGYSLQDGILHISYLHFSEGHPLEYFATDLKKRWPSAKFKEDSDKSQQAFETFCQKQKPKRDIFVVLNGSKFQNKVWSALLKIPSGEDRTCKELAVMIKRPKTVASVGNAVNKNDIAIFVPCHRVKGKSGDQKYRWGNDIKAKILADEKR